MNVLLDSLIRVVGTDGAAAALTLPGVLAALMRDAIASFPALRPHQRHAWHSFVVLLAANALHRAGVTEPPEDERAWCALLRGLTPEHADDAPWCLVAPPTRPALLQPPLLSGDLAELKKEVATPDTLDMLVTAKNHDLKQAVMAEAKPDDWLFALVTLQTMEGFLGAGNYGISRMNGGFANRAGLSIAPPGGPGAHVRRDVQRLLALRSKSAVDGLYAAEGALALVWLAPWDGTASLRQDALDPWYIEICRRVRLIEHNGKLAARAGNSKKERIVPLEGGVTGDPWSPLVTKDGTAKSLTVNARGFDYQRMVDLLFGGVTPAPLQEPDATDASEGLHLVARALVRGQGKTEGYHERRVTIPPKVRGFFIRRETDRLARAARERIALAGEMQGRVLKSALLALFQNGPAQIDFSDKDSNRKADAFLRRFDVRVDASFFEDLWREVEQADEDAQRHERAEWVRRLLRHAEDLLRDAEDSAARASRRRFRASVRAADRLRNAAYNSPQLKPFLTKDTPNVVV